MNGHQLVSKAVKTHGIDYATGIVGQGSSVLIGLLEQAHVPFIRTMHEKNAVHIADGYFRACGRLMAVVLPSRNSLINALSGIDIASHDSSSVLVINSNYSHLVNEGFINETVSFDDSNIDLSHITSYQKKIYFKDEVMKCFDEAIASQSTGLPCPISIEIPTMFSKEESLSVQNKIPQILRTESSIPNEYLHSIAGLIVSSEKPAMLIGGRVISSDSCDEIMKLSTLLDIPVIATCYAKGSFPEDNELFGGAIDIDDMQNNNVILKEADLIIALECECNFNTKEDTAKYFNAKKYIEVGLKSTKIASSNHENFVLNYNTKKFLIKINKLIASMYSELLTNKKDAYRAYVRQIRAEWINTLVKDYNRDIGPMTIMGLITEIREKSERDAILVTSPGYLQEEFYRNFPVYMPRTFICSAHPTALGWALPAAIGVKLAMPARQVICVLTGNDLMLSVQELALCVMHTLPITFIVVSDNYNAKNIDGNLAGSDDFAQFTMPDGKPYQPDYTDIARDIGLEAWKVEYSSQLNRCLPKIFRSNGPTLIDVRVEKESQFKINNFERTFPTYAYLKDEKEIIS